MYDAIVIGGGQAGLAVGYYLKKSGLDFVILDAAERTGDAWRRRWDSLRLFTPARFDGLPGMPFPAAGNYFPTKDEMADFLEAYARRFELPVNLATAVTRLRQQDGRYVLTTADGVQLEARQVVVAMTGYQNPRVPSFAGSLRDDVVQLHSSHYRHPSQLREGGVLVVGGGNSGAEIAKELSSTRTVWVSGPDVGQIPFEVGGLLGRLALTRLLLRVIFHRVLTIRSRIGRKLYAKLTSGSGPLIRVKNRQLQALGVRRVARTVGVVNGSPQLADGTVMDVANVVWCTGYDSGLAWIDAPVLGLDGKPQHEGGLVASAPGLYFVGRHFLYSMSSSMIHGVGRDAERIVAAVVARTKSALTRGVGSDASRLPLTG